MLQALLAISIATAWTPIPRGSDWLPGGQLVREARRQLNQAVLAEAKLAGKLDQLPSWSTYSFQYQGRVVEGRRMIYVNAYCTPPPAYARTEFVRVLDGGPCYFFALYDVASKRYAAVVFNGRG